MKLQKINVSLTNYRVTGKSLLIYRYSYFVNYTINKMTLNNRTAIQLARHSKFFITLIRIIKNRKESDLCEFRTRIPMILLTITFIKYLIGMHYLFYTSLGMSRRQKYLYIIIF